MTPKISLELTYQEVQDLLSSLTCFERKLEDECRPSMKSPQTLKAIKRLIKKLWKLSDEAYELGDFEK